MSQWEWSSVLVLHPTSRFQPPADLSASLQVSLASPGAPLLMLTHSSCVFGLVPLPSHLFGSSRVHWTPALSSKLLSGVISDMARAWRGAGFSSWSVVRMPGYGSHAGSWLYDVPCCTLWPKGTSSVKLLLPRRGVHRAPKIVECQHHAMVCAEVTEAPDLGTQLESLGLGWDQTQFLMPPTCSKCLGHMDWLL